METVTEFVIDLSGSMKGKIDLTKQILLYDIIPTLDYSSRIGIKSFSALVGVPPVIQELPLSIVDKDAIITAVNNLNVKQGGTPISLAIRESVITLKEYSSSKKKIILVTDGQEDKGGDYVSECKKAQTEGINCEIHVIGIGLNDQAKLKAEGISKLSNGTYSHIPFSKGQVYNQTNIKANLKSFYTANSKTASAPQPVFVPKEIVTQSVNIKEEIPKEKDAKLQVDLKSENSMDTNDILKMLIREVKELKEDFKNLKADKQEEIENEKLNESIRFTAEKYLFEILKSKYPGRVKWLNETGESNSDHDFEIIEDDGTIEYYIECRGTDNKASTFYISKNEWKLFLNNTRNYQLYFIQNVFTAPNHIYISNVLDWVLKGKLLPYLKSTDIVKKETVFLTISDSHFV